MRLSKILLALESGAGNVLALERAVRLARKENARLTICDAVESVPRDYGRLITAITPRELIDSIVAEKLERIAVLLESVASDDLIIDKRVLVGSEYIEIARLVREGHYDLVVKPIAGRRAMRSRYAKRKYRDLMRHCQCPVWLVNVADLTEDSSIIAALDMPDNGATSSPLNDHILQISRSIALATFRDLHVVHAWTLPGEGHLRARGGASANLEVDRLVAREAALRAEWLHKAVYSSGSDDEDIANRFLAPKLHAAKGYPGIVIPELAETFGAGLLVLGTAARVGLRGVLLGNTSEDVVSRTDSSLLIVKEPRSFGSGSFRPRGAPESLVVNHKELRGTANTGIFDSSR